MSKNALEIARKYGKEMSVVEIARKILAEKERDQMDKKGTSENYYGTRVAEDMYNIPAYSEPQCVIVSSSRHLQVMQWGLLPRTAKPEDVEKYNKLNWFKNANGERIFETWPYRNIIMRRRCLIPSTGFMEYHHFNGKDKQPFFITIPSREVFCMAGLWDRWPIPGKGGTRDGGDDLDNPDFDRYIYSFTQITTDANEFMRKIHNGGNNPYRMPMILREEDETRWIDPDLTQEEVRALIVPYTAEPMAAHPISKKFQQIYTYNEDVIQEIARDQELELGD